MKPLRAAQIATESSVTGCGTAAAPAYDAGWATEIALDVQWVHATAPLARIVLIEAVDPGVNSLVGAIKLANAMGPGVVSMSFGAPEGTYTAASDSAEDAAAVKRHDGLRNRWFLDPLFRGQYPQDIADDLAAFMPLVPHASSGRSGLLSQTSVPG